MTIQEDVRSSAESIAWHAHREAEVIDDLSLVEELDAYLAQKPTKDHRSAAYFLIGKIGKNCRSPQCASRLIAHASVESDKHALSGLLDRLAEIPKPPEVDIRPLFDFLKDRRAQVRHSAIRALIGSTAPEAENKLLEILTGSINQDDIVYCQATLNHIGTSKALAVLERNFGSRKRDVKLSAEAAITSIQARMRR